MSTETVPEEGQWQVNMVSAYGRGESLALALQENGFDVQIFDFTEALGPEWNRGLGPYPIAASAYLPKNQVLDEVRPLSRGLTFWLPDGPIELKGGMSEFFTKKRRALQHLQQGPASDFEGDWLRRFMKIWSAPFQWEAWQAQPPANPFPYEDEIGLVPASKEARVLSFERFQTLEHKILSCQILCDVQFEGARIMEFEIECGRREAYRAPQWIWCLSSQETDRVGVEVAQNIFSRGIRKAEWHWLNFQGTCDRGPWSAGFPEYSVVINDLYLPWTYTNMMVLRWTDVDVFQVWLKVPALGVHREERRQEWVKEVRAQLEKRLPHAGWSLDGQAWSLCPHSPVFDPLDFEESVPAWKNWDWIAPETMGRLDFSARFELEAASFKRLKDWRTEQIKKQGVRRDHALHAP